MTGQRDIMLTGLIGSSPLGALAAFGLLRACSEIPELSKALLHWQMEDDWVAVLTVPGEIDEDGLIGHLVARQQMGRLDVFNWSPDIRVPPQEYRTLLIQQVKNAHYRDRWSADYYTAFGSETVTDGSKGLVKPTAFHMASGQQKFLESIVEVGKSLRDGGDNAFKEALFGPWKYNDDQHHLGFDPFSERLYALRHKRPEKDRTKRSVRAAVWLAIESLPLFPTAPVSRNKLLTTGFSRTRRTPAFTWPIWRDRIGLDTLKTLLATSELIRHEGWDAFERRGVAAIYETVRSDFGQGYAILRPATLVWAAGGNKESDGN